MNFVMAKDDTIINMDNVEAIQLLPSNEARVCFVSGHSLHLTEEEFKHYLVENKSSTSKLDKELEIMLDELS